MPKITSIDQFEDQWVQWWSAAQPEWRDTGHWPFAHGEVAGDWGKLSSGGKDGLFLVMMALGWWAHARDPAVGSQLDSAISDVSWVMLKLITSLCAHVVTHNISPDPSITPSWPQRERAISVKVDCPKKCARV